MRRFFLGNWLPIDLISTDEDGDEAAPDAAPTITLYPNGSDTAVTGHDTVKMPPFRKDFLTGHFRTEIQLDSNFSAGRYRILKEWTISSNARASVSWFEVVAGGNANGAYIAMEFYRRPHADFIVGQLDTGTVDLKEGPRV